jgi:hypothetical protein
LQFPKTRKKKKNTETDAANLPPECEGGTSQTLQQTPQGDGRDFVTVKAHSQSLMHHHAAGQDENRIRRRKG